MYCVPEVDRISEGALSGSIPNFISILRVFTYRETRRTQYIQQYFLCSFFTPDGSEPFWDKSGTYLNETKVLNFFYTKNTKLLPLSHLFMLLVTRTPNKEIFELTNTKKHRSATLQGKLFKIFKSLS